MISHHNFDYSGGYPNAVDDRYYAQDLARDQGYLLDTLGKSLSSIYPNTKTIINGGIVTQGTGDTLNITAAVALVSWDITVPDSYSSLPPSTKTETIKKLVESEQQTNMTITSATLDGATINYVKLAYAEDDSSNTRQKIFGAGTYSYEKDPTYLITVDSTAPTDYEALLASFTGTAGGSFTITDANFSYLHLLEDEIELYTRSQEDVISLYSGQDMWLKIYGQNHSTNAGEFEFWNTLTIDTTLGLVLEGSTGIRRYEDDEYTIIDGGRGGNTGGTIILNGPNEAIDPNQIVFYNGNGALSYTEAMRIDGSGRLLIGYDTSQGSYELQVDGSVFFDGDITLYDGSTSQDRTLTFDTGSYLMWDYSEGYFYFSDRLYINTGIIPILDIALSSTATYGITGDDLFTLIDAALGDAPVGSVWACGGGTRAVNGSATYYEFYDGSASAWTSYTATIPLVFSRITKESSTFYYIEGTSVGSTTAEDGRLHIGIEDGDTVAVCGSLILMIW